MPELRTRPASLDLDTLRGAVNGAVLAPGDDGYDEARVVGLGGVDDRPAAIVRVSGPGDICAVLAVVRETGLELAVRAGGHSGAGHSTVEGGIVIDVRDLTSLEVDVADRTAWVGAGLTAGEVTRSLAEHGLAIGFGDTGSVGAAGITLGGGMGYLVRKHGMTIDSLLAAEVVTASGDVLTADDTSHPDLFWGLRGGGGNFGVVTRFRFRLQPLERVVGGMLILPATVETLTGFMAACAAAPEELSAIANVMPCPPMPFVPEAHHGEVVLMAEVCWSGAVEDGAAALEPIRSLAEPLVDMVAPITYPEMYPPSEGDSSPLVILRSMFMDGVDEGDARAILDGLAECDAPMRVVQLRPLGGAMARVPSDATAFAHRGRAVMGGVVAFYEGPEHRERRETWVADLAAALRDGDGVYVNFLEDEGPARVREAYPGDTWTRLVDVKRRYDPDNLFHRNQNVDPG
jgi:FAD/FMN-containing dehydrogenase